MSYTECYNFEPRVTIGDFNKLQNQYKASGDKNHTVNQRTPISYKNDPRQAGDIDYFSDYLQAHMDWVQFQLSKSDPLEIQIPYDTDWLGEDEGCIEPGAKGDWGWPNETIALTLTLDRMGNALIQLDNGSRLFLTQNQDLYSVTPKNTLTAYEKSSWHYVISDLGVEEDDNSKFKDCLKKSVEQYVDEQGLANHLNNQNTNNDIYKNTISIFLNTLTSTKPMITPDCKTLGEEPQPSADQPQIIPANQPQTTSTQPAPQQKEAKKTTTPKNSSPKTTIRRSLAGDD